MSTFTETPVPSAPPDQPTVFVINQGSYGSGDVAGVLMHADGEPGWSHISSSEGWLVRDLVTGSPDRRADLVSRYGETVNYAIVRGWSNAPEWLRKAHDAWSAAQDAGADE